MVVLRSRNKCMFPNQKHQKSRFRMKKARLITVALLLLLTSAVNQAVSTQQQKEEEQENYVDIAAQIRRRLITEETVEWAELMNKRIVKCYWPNQWEYFRITKVNRIPGTEKKVLIEFRDKDKQLRKAEIYRDPEISGRDRIVLDKKRGT